MHLTLTFRTAKNVCPNLQKPPLSSKIPGYAPGNYHLRQTGDIFKLHMLIMFSLQQLKQTLEAAVLIQRCVKSHLSLSFNPLMHNVQKGSNAPKHFNLTTYRSNRPEVFCKKSVLTVPFLIKLQAWGLQLY